jgi:Ca2+-binding RTX toxin-like protein
MGGVDVSLRRGRATGDDTPEGISGIENLIGSAFEDRLVGRGGGFVRGILGSDSCSGFAFEDCDNSVQGRGVAMISDPNSLDPGLIVMGGSGPDTLAVSRSGSAYRISGSPIDAGPGCGRVSGGDLVCSAPRVLGYLLVWGGDRGDLLSARGLPAASLVKLDGGPGDDVLSGAGGSDLLYAGEGGSDLLLGRGGDDALISRPGGRDRLFGGRGNDQLVTNSPCGGHLHSGGPGKADVAGFGHTIAGGVRARIGGKGRLRGSGGGCRPTRIRGNSEVLEGTRHADILIASNRGDLLIGRNGNDRCIGGRHKRC